MLDVLQSTFNAILDRSPKELIGAGLVALALAIAMTGLYALGRRKVGEPLTLVIGLMLFANVASMALAVGYLEQSQRNSRQTIETVLAPPPYHPHGNGPELGLSQRILDIADTNKDAALSTEEAKAAAAEFVRKASKGGEVRLDVSSLAQALRGDPSSGQPPLWPFPRHGGPGPGPRIDSLQTRTETSRSRPEPVE